MGSKREKYPEKCPWDLGPNQNLAKEENWILRLGEANVCFSKNKLDNNYFHVYYSFFTFYKYNDNYI